MQYLLTKEELDALVPKEDKKQRDKALEIARKRILELSGRECAHDNHSLRCDGCPCLQTDQESKDYQFSVGSSHDLYQLHKLICSLPRNFSK